MYQLQVENMSCGHCVGSVTKAVQGIDPAAQVQIDLASKSVKVESSGALDSIKAAIVDAGYPVTSAQ
ncbi:MULTISPECIES: heavy-metal-associated domain-containing protein [unclassified Janthinobacterium]|jgi:copper chaperone|uniref:heavy-metal-associated domain-containing protein n=1 Tax=unclassified Janthinobacterium TaxID=2610881 RepID=UPI00160796FA|nr:MULTISPECIES: heavy-metal-associated domain-containing protein [unclassified Janthinobacterium]MBB5367260.1 copper chaperone [Janthinobacterium sp. K2C7]MBB5380262.1 copper chaperone [Janthinobacterium sp. K2Li3]MBB5385642.1 copper chaperone [Janthinobacterium sp. K2E3]MBB5607794.1 copper chaperone [Janthinobacterium sp. S3T4]MBB5613057.1 copper chaperone [Janthinobacterium sp. S3M3]